MESLPEGVRASAPDTSAERLSVATRGRLQRRRYVFHADAGHGWLAVKRADLETLGIAGDVSRCSYQRGGTVYLEEDRDAGLFVHAFYAAVGREPTIKRGASPDRSPIRSYASYVPDPSDETLAEVIDNAAAELGFRNASDNNNDAGSSSVGEILPGRDLTHAAVLLVHNHPSGDTTPSREDRLVTDRLEKAGELIGITVLDHLIVANGGCLSLREGGAA